MKSLFLALITAILLPMSAHAATDLPKDFALKAELGIADASDGLGSGLAWGLSADYYTPYLAFGPHFRMSEHGAYDFTFIGLEAWRQVGHGLKVGGDLGVARYENSGAPYRLGYGLKLGWDYKINQAPGLMVGVQGGFINVRPFDNTIWNTSLLASVSYAF